MASDDRTDRYVPVFEPEEILDRFVRNANGAARAPRDDEPTGMVSGGKPVSATRGRPAPWDHAITVRAKSEPPPPAKGANDARVEPGGELLTESGQRVVLLTKVKRRSEPPAPAEWTSVVAPRGQHTQKLEALRVVPDVGTTARWEPVRLRESSEDGQIPTRELDAILSDMAVLLRYGHAGQVRDRLEQLRRTYPEDLLLLRRIAEFHVEHGDDEAALETLFALASGLFERRNVEGMRQALEQVLVLDPDNARAYRLLGLLGQRPGGAPR